MNEVRTSVAVPGAAAATVIAGQAVTFLPARGSAGAANPNDLRVSRSISGLSAHRLLRIRQPNRR
jgi:hypothetical protein